MKIRNLFYSAALLGAFFVLISASNFCPAKRGAPRTHYRRDQSRSDPPRPSGPVSAHRARPRRRERSLREHSYQRQGRMGRGIHALWPIATSTKQSRWRHLTQPRQMRITSGRGGLYSFGRWPIPRRRGSSARMKKAIEAFLAHARFMDPPLEVVHIPFEGKEIIAYLRLPKKREGAGAAGACGQRPRQPQGRSRRKFRRDSSFGIGYLAVDGPGTGQNPIKVSETADRVLSKVIDYAQSRPEIDKNRIACTA